MVQDPSQGAPSPVPATGVRAAGLRACPSCGTAVGVHATVCPSCGEQLSSKQKKIRCRRCHKLASASLVVCPHCGRDLIAAPSRLLTWGLPLLVMVLLLGVLATRWNRGNPVNWAQSQAERLTRVMGMLGDRLHPELSIAMIPAGEDASDPLISQVRQAASNATTPQADAPPTAPEQAPPTATSADGATAPLATIEPSPSTQPAPTATTAATPATTSTPPVATVAATPTSTASVAATATPTLSTTAASGLFGLPTPTPLVAAAGGGPVAAVQEVYKVRAGDTLFDIANRYDLSVDELLATNQLTEDDVYTIQPGDELKIPAPTPAPDTTPAAAAAKPTYTIRSGDTLLAIALRLGVTIEDLRAANNMSVTQGRVLRPGDELIIPGQAGAEPVSTPAPTVTAPPTETTMPTATPLATSTPTAASAIRLDAPLLRAPEDGTSVSCSDGETLVWQPVPSIKGTDLYTIHLGYINGRNSDGSDEVVWVLAQPRPSNATSWQLDNSLCGLAPLAFGRQWRWYVEVAEKTAGGTQPVSSPSAIWRFTWQ